DDDVGHEHGSPDDAGNTDPLAPFEIRIGRQRVEGAEADRVYPDGRLPPRRPRDQQWVEGATPPMDEIYQRRWRPERIDKVRGVGDRDLLEVYDVGDETEVDKKKGDEEQVQPAARKRNWSSFGGWQSGPGGGRCGMRHICHWPSLSHSVASTA